MMALTPMMPPLPFPLPLSSPFPLPLLLLTYCISTIQYHVRFLLNVSFFFKSQAIYLPLVFIPA